MHSRRLAKKHLGDRTRLQLMTAFGACLALASAQPANAQGLGYFLIRYNTAGAVDSGFPTTGHAQGNHVLEASATSPFGDGTIATVGFFDSDGNPPHHFIVPRYFADGRPDILFNLVNTGQAISGASEHANYVGFQSSRKIIIAGVSYDSMASGRLWVARFNSDGGLDTTFGRSGFNFVFHTGDVEPRGLRINADDSILVAATQNGSCSVARFTKDGGRDLSWGQVGGTVTFNVGTTGSDNVSGFTVDKAGRLVVGCGELLGSRHQGIARFTATGALDAFGANGIASVPRQIFDIATDLGDRPLILGPASNGDRNRVGITRLTTGGSPDNNFPVLNITWPGVTNGVNGVAIRVQRGPGNIFVAGYSLINNKIVLLVARLLNTGISDASFGTNGRVVTGLVTHAVPHDMSIDPDGRPVLVGSLAF